MIFQVRFTEDGCKKVAWVHGTDSDEKASLVFSVKHPDATHIEAKAMKGTVIDASHSYMFIFATLNHARLFAIVMQPYSTDCTRIGEIVHLNLIDPEMCELAMYHANCVMHQEESEAYERVRDAGDAATRESLPIVDDEGILIVHPN